LFFIRCSIDDRNALDLGTTSSRSFLLPSRASTFAGHPDRGLAAPVARHELYAVENLQTVTVVASAEEVKDAFVRLNLHRWILHVARAALLEPPGEQSYVRNNPWSW
jgi:hypothetical protein